MVHQFWIKNRQSLKTTQNDSNSKESVDCLALLALGGKLAISERGSIRRYILKAYSERIQELDEVIVADGFWIDITRAFIDRPKVLMATF